MRPFAETVAEFFHSMVELTWRLKADAQAIARFSVSTVRVEVSFEQREAGGPWHVAFEVVSGDIADRTFLAFHIFNGVFQAVREFLEVREPEVLVFITKRDELAGIYETYLRREKPALEQSGYRLEGPDRVEPYTQCTLRLVSGWKDAGRP